MTDLERLKPCPFCGESVEMNDYTDKPACAWVMIHRCKIIGPIKMDSYSASALAQTWNTRASDAALLVAEKALRELSFLGNGDRPGNSDGNMIARAALSEIEKLTGGGE